MCQGNACYCRMERRHGTSIPPSTCKATGETLALFIPYTLMTVVTESHGRPDLCSTGVRAEGRCTSVCQHAGAWGQAVTAIFVQFCSSCSAYVAVRWFSMDGVHPGGVGDVFCHQAADVHTCSINLNTRPFLLRTGLVLGVVLHVCLGAARWQNKP